MEKKENKDKADPLKALMSEMLRALAVSESKLEAKFDEVLGGVRSAVEDLDAVVSAERQNNLELKDRLESIAKRHESLEHAHNKMHSDFGAFQNKMFGLDALPARCDRHDADLKTLRLDMVDLRDHMKRLDALEMQASDMMQKHKALDYSVGNINERLGEKLRAVKDRLAECECYRRDERDRVNGSFDEMKKESLNRFLGLEKDIDMLSDKLKGALANQDQVQSSHDHSIANLMDQIKDVERLLLKKIDDGVSPFRADLKDCIDRIDFAEAQGNRLNRLEKFSGQHDQMIKEMYRQIKEMQ
jgi:hypothetical protein